MHTATSHGGLGRLRRRREFLAAAKGRRHHAALFTLQAATRPEGVDGQGLRVGLTVTKKTGHAPERNRIRRRLRSALHAVNAEHRDWPADLVVVARREILSAPFDRLMSDLSSAVTALRRKTRREAVPDPAFVAASHPGLPRRRGRPATDPTHVPPSEPLPP